MQRYTISRNGQTYGPYSMEELQRYLVSGHVLPTDLARTDDTSEWVPVAQLLGTPGAVPAVGYIPPTPGHLSPVVEAPPNLNWGLLVLFGLLTCGLFTVIYEFIQAAWLRRIYPASRVLLLYIIAAVFYLINISSTVAKSTAALHGQLQPPTAFNVVGGLASLVYLILVLAARFTMRAELERHYNTVEPIGLTLSGVMTFFFGSFYFQYHFNRINELKRAMLFAAAAAPR